VINENDTVATAEIRYGDNDRLGARVASMMEADMLVLLSDIDGLYTANPQRDADAKHIPEVRAITPEIERMAEGPCLGPAKAAWSPKSPPPRSPRAGRGVIISNGHVLHPLAAIAEAPRTTCSCRASRRRKPRSAGSPAVVGAGTIVHRLRRGTGAAVGQEPASCRRQIGHGQFERGDAVLVKARTGASSRAGSLPTIPKTPNA
jgi:glutamate 5-kinase